MFKVLGYDRNNLLINLASGGILNYWLNFETNPSGIDRKNDGVGPQVLTVDHLMMGFQIFLAALLISLIAFVGEVAIEYLKNVRENEKNVKD